MSDILNLDHGLRALVIRAEPEDEAARIAFSRWNIEAEFLADAERALGLILETPPDIIVLDLAHGDYAPRELARILMRDPALSHIPLIVHLDGRELDQLIAWEALALNDFITDWRDPEILALRIRLCCETGSRELDANPLTHLGGNNAIRRCIEKRLASGEDFAVAYLDLDNFKAFNDCYGFERGDDVIRLAARLLCTVLQAHVSPEKSMLGHVGGDDFVFMLPEEEVVPVCEDVIDRFDKLIKTFYDEDDARRGGIHSINRVGDAEFFPLISLSIAVAVNRRGSIAHPGQFSAVLGDLKRHAKAKRVSNYVVDRRLSGKVAESLPEERLA